jgi:ATP-dependent Clp protease protease subunit
MSALLLAGGAKEKRYALPHARIMIHQPLGGASGQASDLEIQAKEILKMKQLLNSLLARHTGQATERIEADADRDYFMTAMQAKEYGLIDFVIEQHEDVPGMKDEKKE